MLNLMIKQSGVRTEIKIRLLRHGRTIYIILFERHLKLTLVPKYN